MCFSTLRYVCIGVSCCYESGVQHHLANDLYACVYVFVYHQFPLVVDHYAFYVSVCLEKWMYLCVYIICIDILTNRRLCFYCKSVHAEFFVLVVVGILDVKSTFHKWIHIAWRTKCRLVR